MTDQIGIHQIAAPHQASAAMLLAPRAGLGDQPAPIAGRLAAMAEPIAAATRRFLQQFRAALHESRRKQAAIQCARYQHLVYDADTAMMFGAPTLRDPRAWADPGRASSAAFGTLGYLTPNAGTGSPIGLGTIALQPGSTALLTKTAGLCAGKAPRSRRQEPIMTAELDLRDSTRRHLPPAAPFALGRLDDSPARDRPVPVRLVLGILLDAIISAAATCHDRLLDALHESRRKQAAIELARYRHLIYDPETGVSFGIDRPHRRAPWTGGTRRIAACAFARAARMAATVI
jgi:hypothetical protein